MPKVKNLKIALQSGTDNTYYASWEFQEETTTKTTSTFKKGDLVSIKSGATYYNGVAIPSWVMSRKWYLIQATGDRAVLGKDESGSYNIVSPINTKYLTGATSTSGTSTTVSQNTLDHYDVKWSYDTGDGVWFSGGSSSTTSAGEDSSVTEEATEKYSTYSAPSNALKIKVSVKPVSKTHKVNDEDTEYWTGSWVSATHTLSVDPPEQISISDVEIEVDKYKLTASIENVKDARADFIQFQVFNNLVIYHSGKCRVKQARASYSCTIGAGGEYRVRCRAINMNGSQEVYGEWSDWSSAITTIPATPADLTVCRASSDTSVYLEWAAVKTAETYDIEYTTKITYFDGSDETTTKTGIENTHWEVTGLETGQEYFFRYRAVNENGESAWSTIKSVVIGKDPAAPTTWSSTTTAVTGEKLYLYWVHNAEDGSSETYADLEMYIDGKLETHTVEKSTDEDEKDKISFFEIDTSVFVEGTVIEWRVRTAGITKKYGEWSIQRKIDVYAPPTLELKVTDLEENVIETLTSFPCYVYALAGPSSQIPIGYHLTVTSNEIYETVDQVGNVKMVNNGDAVYSKYFDIQDSLLVELSANNIDLENGVKYTVTCTVSMDSGLTSTATTEFDVSWTDEDFEPDMEIAVDKDNYVTYIRPYCRDSEGALIEGVLLSVYRREFDGTFTELALRLDNTKNTMIADPHPALDYARYRIVAISEATGAVSFYDPPGYPMGGKSVIIQWDEEWTSFETANEDALEQPPWSGSMLKLPYNIDVSDNNSLDVELVEYIGRAHPVSYYGTQLGTTSTWNMVIEKKDKETLYGLRRLAIWRGDVYVREPSGSGYWANISVSFSQKHLDLTIPVTLDIVRVEGGI